MPETTSLSAEIERTTRLFRETFDAAPSHAAAAPGRVNLIGEHTDYNDGFVLPMAIDRHTFVTARPRDDTRVRLASSSQEGIAEFEADASLAPGEPAWTNYVRGVVAAFQREGTGVAGFDAAVHSTVPLGGGLSSSASLEVAMATLLEAITGHTLDPREKARMCQWAEHEFAGMPCGIMDQFITTMGEAGAALLIDCRSHEARSVPLDDPSVSVLIINSNVKHELVGGEYGERREQCEKAAQLLGVSALRDATRSMLEAKRDSMDELTYRRARHVVTENERTEATAEAMGQRDWLRVGRLMGESHASLRDDFEVSCRELDMLVELAQSHADAGEVIGSRMTGGGFGGCTVSLVKTDAAERLSQQISEAYQQHIDKTPSAFVTKPAAGARVIEL